MMPHTGTERPLNSNVLMVFLFIAPRIAVAAIPERWAALALQECTRVSEKAWEDHGWPIHEKKIPAATCSDFMHFSSRQIPDFLIHQDEYTGGGGFYRWFVLEGLDPNGKPRFLAQDRRSTARFTTIAGEILLEEFDGESISLSRWTANGLQSVLRYRANDFAFQVGPVFGALRAFDPKTKAIFIVKYSAQGRDAILNSHFSWSVDRYDFSSGRWTPAKADIPFSKALKARLTKLDSSFAQQLAMAEKGNFTFDEDFGWHQR